MIVKMEIEDNHPAKWIFLYLVRYLLIVIVFLISISVPPGFSNSRFDNSLIPRGLPVRLLGGINKISQDGHGFICPGYES